MKKGDIVSVFFPFTNLTEVKRRPALVLYAHKDDVVLAFITSKINNPDDSDVFIERSGTNNLQTNSLIIFRKVFTGNTSLIKGKIGEIENKYYTRINEVLKEILFF